MVPGCLLSVCSGCFNIDDSVDGRQAIQPQIYLHYEWRHLPELGIIKLSSMQ